MENFLIQLLNNVDHAQLELSIIKLYKYVNVYLHLHLLHALYHKQLIQQLVNVNVQEEEL
jgi:hypothetical protein